MFFFLRLQKFVYRPLPQKLFFLLQISKYLHCHTLPFEGVSAGNRYLLLVSSETKKKREEAETRFVFCGSVSLLVDLDSG